MTELDEANRKRYLEIVEQLYDLDDKSMEFIKKRTTDEWQPVKEYQEFLKGVKYENQRYRFPVDFKNKTLTRTITQYDESYQLFTRYFSRVLGAIEVSYDDFLNNKIVYQKNVTKIKKVFEKWYLNHWRHFCSQCSNSGLVSYDSHASSDEEKLKYIKLIYKILTKKKKRFLLWYTAQKELIFAHFVKISVENWDFLPAWNLWFGQEWQILL